VEALVWFKHRAWIPIAWLLSLSNVGAVWFAALPGEPWHATTHALLAVLFAVGARQLMTRRVSSPIDESRADRLQQGIDVIALEVERISEGQRYVTKVLNEKLAASIGPGEAQAMAVERQDAAAVRMRDKEP
jgi:membrane protein implicated in regulation of membrane protease activity